MLSVLRKFLFCWLCLCAEHITELVPLSVPKTEVTKDSALKELFGDERTVTNTPDTKTMKHHE